MSDAPPTAPGGNTVVYVELLDESVGVWRPVLAAKESGAYRLPAEVPEGERWAVEPGALVRCELIDGYLHAVET